MALKLYTIIIEFPNGGRKEYPNSTLRKDGDELHICTYLNKGEDINTSTSFNWRYIQNYTIYYDKP
jgi:hypothetical protein